MDRKIYCNGINETKKTLGKEHQVKDGIVCDSSENHNLLRWLKIFRAIKLATVEVITCGASHETHILSRGPWRSDVRLMVSK